MQRTIDHIRRLHSVNYRTIVIGAIQVGFVTRHWLVKYNTALSALCLPTRLWGAESSRGVVIPVANSYYLRVDIFRRRKSFKLLSEFQLLEFTCINRERAVESKQCSQTVTALGCNLNFKNGYQNFNTPPKHVFRYFLLRLSYVGTVRTFPLHLWKS